MRSKGIVFKNAGIPAIVTDVDTESRKVKAYASAFDNIDAHGDMVVKGAFAKSINDRGVNSTSNRKIAHLLQHDMASPIGRITELYEDEKGLVFVSELSKSTKGNDALIQYQEGILREHSIGFNIVKEDYIEKEEAETMGINRPFFKIKEVNLWEVSTVTFGANENTPVLEVSKSLEEQTETLSKQFTIMQKLLRKGGLSDESCYLIEYQLECMKTQLNSLLDQKEPPQNTLKDNEPRSNRDFLLNYLNAK